MTHVTEADQMSKEFYGFDDPDFDVASSPADTAQIEAAAKQLHHEFGCTITAARIAATRALAAADRVRAPQAAAEGEVESSKPADWLAFDRTVDALCEEAESKKLVEVELFQKLAATMRRLKRDLTEARCTWIDWQHSSEAYRAERDALAYECNELKRELGR